jgi:sec-independent protein translocase protein TatA
MFGLGWQELLLIMVITLIFFGPSKLPEVGKSLGKAINGLKEGTKKIQNELSDEFKEIKDNINGK